MQEQPRDRSLFWPIVFIGVGVVWLLANFNVIGELNWGMLLRLWPLLLIVAGVELLVGRNRPWVSALTGLLVVGAAIAVLVFGPQLGLARSPQIDHEQVSIPLDGAGAARVSLDLSFFRTTITGDAPAGQLLEGNLAYTGRIVVTEGQGSTSSGGGLKTLEVRHEGDPGNSFFLFDFLDTVDARWDVGVSGDVPLELRLDVGSGPVEVDLGGVQVTGLTIDGGSGPLDLTLPTGGNYVGRINGGSGPSEVMVPAGANATLEYDGGSGPLTVDVPDGLAVRVEVRDEGSGSVSLPRGWETVREGDDDEGEWQTAGFDAASVRFTLIVTDLGSGSVTVR
jgi:hypothetical protein